MTEADWQTCTDSQAMLNFLGTSGRVSDRKLRLFIAACARSLRPVFGDTQEEVAVLHEHYADGLAAETDLIRYFAGEMFDRLSPEGVIPPTCHLPPVWDAARLAAKTATDFTDPDCRDNTEGEKARICSLLRDIVGPLLFRPLPPLPPSVRAWNDGYVVKLATAIYRERQVPSGQLDNTRLAVLADALEEAGWEDQSILDHLRQQEGVHVCGCYLLDWLMGRE